MSVVKSSARYLVALCLLPLPCLAQDTFWTQLAGPFGGTVNAITFTPSGQVLAGTTRNLYRLSGDNTWQKIEHQDRHTTALAYHPDGYVLVGTPNGLFRLDEGANQLEPLGYPYRVQAITVTPDSTIFIGGGILRSSDGGKTFTSVGPSNVFPFSLLADSSGTIYAGLWQKGVLRSTDNGDTWESLNNGLISGSIRTAWDLTYDGRGNLYAATSDGLFQFTDDETWVRAGLEGIFIFALGLDREGNLLVGTAQNGLYVSTDGGAQWVQQTDGLPAGNIRTIALDGEGRILVGTNHHGIFRQPSPGSTWTMWNEGISDTKITALTIDPDGNVLAAIGGVNTGPNINIVPLDYTGGLFRSTDKGLSWREITTGPSRETTVNVLSTGIDGALYAATTNEGVYRSEDGGASWTQFMEGLWHNIHLRNVISLAFNQAADVFAGTCCGVYHLKNGDTRWELLATEGLPVSDSLYRIPFPINTLTVATDGTLYAGTEAGIYRFDEPANIWVASNIAVRLVRALLVDREGTLMAGSWLSGFFTSSDGGTTWVAHNTGLTDLHVGILAINAKGERFAATFSDGVFRSAGGVEPWMSVNEGLQGVSVSALSFDSDGFLYAGTEEEGVFRSTRSTLVSVSNPDYPDEATALHPNYPNPFSTTTTISFSLDDHAPVTLKVYNLLGEEVATLFSGIPRAGTYKIEWNAAHLASGVYFCRLESAEQVQMMKMVVLR